MSDALPARWRERRWRLLPWALILGAILAPSSARATTSWAERVITIASWNADLLPELGGDECRARNPTEYAARRHMVEQLDADIIVFRGVETIAAAEQLFNPRRYIVIMAPRPERTSEICAGSLERRLTRQDIGFAMRRGLRFSVHYLRNLPVTGLSGVEIGLRVRGGRHLRLLSFPLPECVTPVCARLDDENRNLERWVQRAIRGPYRFIVVRGDGRTSESDARFPLSVGLSLASAGAQSRCDPSRPFFAEDFLLDRRALASMRSFREVSFDFGDRRSSHCPVVLQISLWGGR